VLAPCPAAPKTAAQVPSRDRSAMRLRASCSHPR
jgi:hypothetical protein